MIVIVEGPDGVGKSTLIRHIRRDFFDGKVDIFKFSDTSDVSFNNYKEKLEADLGNIIMDRFNLSEDVYSTVYQRYPKNSLLDHLKTFSLIEDLDAIYIILYSSNLDLLWERCHQRGDTEKVYNNLLDLNDYYYQVGKELRKLYPRNIKLIDVAATANIFEDVEKILKEVQDEQNKSNND